MSRSPLQLPFSREVVILAELILRCTGRHLKKRDHHRIESLRYQWNNAISTLFRTINCGAIGWEDPDVKRYYRVFLDVLELEAKVRECHESLLWSLQNAKSIRKEIKQKFAELDALYMLLTAWTIQHAIHERDRIMRRLSERRKLQAGLVSEEPDPPLGDSCGPKPPTSIH